MRTSLSVLLCLAVNGIALAAQVTGADVGDQAPALGNLTVSPVEGGAQWDDAALEKGLAVLLFWCGQSQACQRAASTVENMAAGSRDLRVSFLAVCADASEAGGDETQARPSGWPYVLDEDGAVFGAYGVERVPECVVVRDGVIVGRRHPAELTVAGARDFLHGMTDPSPDRSGPRRYAMHLFGRDPYSKLAWPPDFQIIVRQAIDRSQDSIFFQHGVSVFDMGDNPMGTGPLGGASGTETFRTGTDLIRRLWLAEPYQVQAPPRLDEERYDVIWVFPDSLRDNGYELLRDAFLAAARVSLETRKETIRGYRLEAVEGGPKLPKAPAAATTMPGGIRTEVMSLQSEPKSGDLDIRGGAATTAGLATMLAAWVNAPVEDAIQSESQYVLNIKVEAGTFEEAIAMLETKYGLKLVPHDTEMDLYYFTDAF